MRLFPLEGRIADLKHRLFAISDDNGIEEISHRLRVEGGRPSCDDERKSLIPIP